MKRELLYKTLRPTGFVPPIGRKPVFLPNWNITLLKAPNLPSNMAKFLVPLNINKLDLKDYLYHAYGLPVLAVRSYIIQQKIGHGKPGDTFFKPRRWFRQRSIKHMIVEMEEPFVWPEEDRDLEEWDKSSFEAASKAQDKLQEQSVLGEKTLRTDQASIREQAKALLEGKEKWRPSWIDYKSGPGAAINATRN